MAQKTLICSFDPFETKRIIKLTLSIINFIIASSFCLAIHAQQPAPFASNHHEEMQQISRITLHLSPANPSLEWITESECSKKIIIPTARFYDGATESRAFHLKQMIDQALSPSYPQPFEPLKTLLGYIQSGNQLVYQVMNEVAECDCIRYDRHQFPEVRGIFEEKMLAELPKSPLIRSNQTVTVAFIGSGFLYSALVKITKMLERHQKLRIVLVDTIYDGLIRGRNQQSTPSEPVHHSQRTAQRNRERAHAACTELGKWLAFLQLYFYKGARIEIMIYKGVHDYITNCKSCSSNGAQVLVIEDLDNPLQYEDIIKNAYSHILQPGGVYAILADQTRLCWEKPNTEREQVILRARINLDDIFGYDLSQNSVKYIHYAQMIAQIRRYVGIKKS